MNKKTDSEVFISLLNRFGIKYAYGRDKNGEIEIYVSEDENKKMWDGDIGFYFNEDESFNHTIAFGR